MIRSSKPSYRPHSSTSRSAPASSSTTRWFSRPPLRAEHDQVARLARPGRCTASTHSTTGSTIITMPGPPPNGRSSTVRVCHRPSRGCCAAARRPVACRSPAQQALAQVSARTSRETGSGRRIASLRYFIGADPAAETGRLLGALSVTALSALAVQLLQGRTLLLLASVRSRRRRTS